MYQIPKPNKNSNFSICSTIFSASLLALLSEIALFANIINDARIFRAWYRIDLTLSTLLFQRVCDKDLTVQPDTLYLKNNLL